MRDAIVRKRSWLVGLAFAALLGCGGGSEVIVEPPAPIDDDPSLGSLALSTGTLVPAFAPATTAYAVGPAVLGGTLLVTPTTTQLASTVSVNGIPVAFGGSSGPISLLVGVNAVTVEVTAPDGVTTRTYTLVVTRLLAQQAYAKASNTGATDSFGWSVAISGDTLVVGAYGEDGSSTGVNGNQADDGAPHAGAAYVFVRSGGVWSQQAYLKASNTQAGDDFGWSVAVSGDTVVVGAPSEDSAAIGVNGDGSNDFAPDSGAAYVFVRSGVAWSQQAYLKAVNTGGGDQFGYSVAVSGDTVVVGAPNEDSAASVVGGDVVNDLFADSGAAYVFVRSGATWSQQEYLKPSNTGAGDQFGFSVALDGDTAVVGARFEDGDATGVDGVSSNTVTDAGAAYVFVRSATPPPPRTWDAASDFGVNVSEAYAIGPESVWAYGDDVPKTNTLLGFIPYNMFSAGSWSYVGDPPPPVAWVGTFTSGPAAFYNHEAENPAPANVLVWVAPRSMTVALTVEMWTPADGVQDARGHNASWRWYARDGQTQLGSASVGIGGGNGHASWETRWIDTAMLAVSTGESISLWHTPQGVQGYVGQQMHIVEQPAVVPPPVSWIQQAYLKASNTGAGDQFGYSVAVSGDTIVVGAALEDSDAAGVGGDEGSDLAPDSGAAYVFLRTGAAWAQQAYLKPTDTDADDAFAWRVAIAGDTVLVGAAAEDGASTGLGGDPTDDAAPSAGAAYLYGRLSGVWTPRTYLKASTTEPGDQLGVSVAASGDTLVAGADLEDSSAVGIGGNQADNAADASGAVYVFR